MIGATLSRWTMSFFAAALVSLIAAECLMVAGYGFPNAALQASESLVLVHIIAIGWLSLLMCGALFQFVPVLIARPLYSNSLPFATLICLVAGLCALVAGFLQLAGQITFEPSAFPLAAVLLGAGFTLVLWNLGRTLWAARPLTIPARFVTVGLASVAATATFGIIFALVLGGFTTYPHLIDVTAIGVPIHVIAGLGGWLTFTAIGVSYRLLAMFMLAPELNGASIRSVLYLGAASLAIAILGGAAAICLDFNLNAVLLASALPGLGALAVYAYDIRHLYLVRNRRKIELNSRMAAVALISLAAAMLLLVIFLGAGTLDRHVGAIVFLISFGWLSGLGLAKLYKIVAFLTWLECYGPVLGKTPTPRVQDLVTEPRAVKWFVIYFASVWGATIALILEFPEIFRFTAAVMTVATAGIIVQLIRTRRLVDVKEALRLPTGTQRPRLLISLAHHS